MYNKYIFMFECETYVKFVLVQWFRAFCVQFFFFIFIVMFVCVCVAWLVRLYACTWCLCIIENCFCFSLFFSVHVHRRSLFFALTFRRFIILFFLVGFVCLWFWQKPQQLLSSPTFLSFSNTWTNMLLKLTTTTKDTKPKNNEEKEKY